MPPGVAVVQALQAWGSTNILPLRNPKRHNSDNYNMAIPIQFARGYTPRFDMPPFQGWGGINILPIIKS
jgi:hypothetical protein